MHFHHHPQPMTSGSIPGHLIRYAIPAVLGDLFQVTYNTVDSIVVGRFAGANALAAVGVANPLMNIAMFFIIGMGIGASVLMSQFYGAGDRRGLKREFSTALFTGLGLSLIVSALFLALVHPLLRLCNTPAEIFADTAAYLRIVAGGFLFTGLYNVLAAALKSIGDTRAPLLCLVAGSVCNVGLDIWFVKELEMGVAGAACATVISQALSAALCALLIRRFAEPLRLGRGDLVVENSLLRRTIHYSYATALQQAGVYVGKLLVQGMVNPLGVSAIAAFNAVNRVDDYALIVERDIGSGIMVMTAQNHGARKPERMLGGLRAGLVMEALYGAAVSAGVFCLATPLVSLFVDAGETQVIQLGTRYLHLMGFFYFMPGITNGLQGYMRGVGKMNLTMYVTYTQMLTRALFTYLLIGSMGMDAVPLACVAGWLVMMVWEVALIILWRKQGRLLDA